MIYFDHAATTPMSSLAIEVMTKTMQETFGNPSSIHQHGRKASKILREARQSLARLLETNPKNIIFTSGGTESNNLAIIGTALANQTKGKHIITTAIEHHSVLKAMRFLTKHHDFEVTYLSPKHGEITATQIQEALRDDTILVSTMYANNETGYLLPISEIGAILKDHQALYHVDAVQVMGKFPVLPQTLHIDLLSASAHKFNGPKGVGFLYKNDSLSLEPSMVGGDQEDKHRAGTENLAAIVGMVTALDEHITHYKENLAQVAYLRQQFLSGLEKNQIKYHINQDTEPLLSHVLNIAFPNQVNHVLLTRLDLAGISVSTGSACTAGAVTPSHVLQAIYGEGSPRLTESLRFSFSEQHTIDDIEHLLTTLTEILGD